MSSGSTPDLGPSDKRRWRRRKYLGYVLPMCSALILSVALVWRSLTVIDVAGSVAVLWVAAFFSSREFARWEARNLAFYCSQCGAIFEITPSQAIKALSWGWRGKDYRRLACPNGHIGWATVVSRTSKANDRELNEG